MRCPRCGNPALHDTQQGRRDVIAVKQCPRCRGCWIGHHALEQLAQGVWSSVDSLQLTSAEALSELVCPECSAQLTRVNPSDHPELAIDRCPSCHGLWLDAGELEALHAIAAQAVAEHGGMRRRPDGWSYARWVTYRLAEQWRRSREE